MPNPIATTPQMIRALREEENRGEYGPRFIDREDIKVIRPGQIADRLQELCNRIQVLEEQRSITTKNIDQLRARLVSDLDALRTSSR